MNSTERSQLRRVLRGRRDAIADRWYKALARSSYVPFSMTEVLQRLVEWTQEAIELLFTEPFDHGRAEAIGASLAGLHYIESEALGRTQEVLGQQLVEGLPAEEMVELQPRVAELLGGVAAGFLRQARETTLAEQEWVRGALLRELRRVTGVLREAYEDVEQQVEERTAELARANEALRAEIAERVRAEMALRDSERRYRLLAENTIDVIWTVDMDLRFTYVSPSVVIMLGYGAEEAIARGLEGILTPASLEAAREALVEALVAVEPRDIYEFELNRKDGSTVWTESKVGFLRAPDGQPVGIQGVTRDITERRRREEEIKQRNRELAALNAIAATVNQSLDLEEVLNEALDRVLETTGLEVGAIRLLDEQSGTLDLKVHRGVDLSPQIIESVSKFNLDEGPLAEAIASGEPLIMEDVSAYPIVELMGRGDLRSWFLIPLGSKGRVLGSIELMSPNPRRFSSEEMGLLTSIGHQIGVAMENARLYEKEQRRVKQLWAVNEVGRKIASILNLDELLIYVVSLLQKTFEYYNVNVFLVDSDAGELVLRAGYGGYAGEPLMGVRLKLGEGIIGWVAKTGEPLLVGDVSQEPRYYFVKELPKTISELAVPIKLGARVIGTLDVQSVEVDAFDEADLSLLQMLADQVGVAIENAMLYKKAQSSADQATALFEISQSLTSSLDLDRTLRLIVEQAAQLLKTDMCTLFLYDRDTGELIGQVRSGASDEDLQVARVPLSHRQTAAEAKATLKPVAVEDTSQDHRVPAEIVEKLGIKSLLTVPLVAEGRFLGVIFLDETEAHRRFTVREIELAQGFASQAAIALQNAQLYAQSEELAIGKERNRIAREIHDDLIQRLASLLMRVDLCLAMMDEDPEEARGELDRLGVALQDSIEATRRSILALRPLALEQLGFRRALGTYVDDFAQQNGISVHVSLPEEGLRLPAKVEYTLFRIVQEALNNVRWHAQADSVWIDLDLRPPSGIWLEIRDNGLGFDVARRDSYIPGDDSRGLGLLHMQERIEAMRGSFRMESVPTGGTKITVTVPFES